MNTEGPFHQTPGGRQEPTDANLLRVGHGHPHCDRIGCQLVTHPTWAPKSHDGHLALNASTRCPCPHSGGGGWGFRCTSSLGLIILVVWIGLLILVVWTRVKLNFRIFNYELFLKYLSFKYGDYMYRFVLKSILIRSYIC